MNDSLPGSLWMKHESLTVLGSTSMLCQCPSSPQVFTVFINYYSVAIWPSSDGVDCINEVTLTQCQAEFILRWMNVCGHTFVICNQLDTQANSASYPQWDRK